MKQIVSLIIALFPLLSLAQNEAKQINAIIRSGQYLYGDVTLETERDAKTAAEKQLEIKIERFIESSPRLKDAESVVVKDILKKAEVIHMRRGTMYRFFLFVEKIGIAPVPVIKVPINEEVASERKDSTDIHIAQVNNSETKVESESNVSSIYKEEWKKTVLDNLLKANDIDDLYYKLSRFKAQGKIKLFSDLDSYEAPNLSNWVVLDSNEKVYTILVPDGNKLINIRTSKIDNPNSYDKMSLIWFTFK